MPDLFVKRYDGQANNSRCSYCQPAGRVHHNQQYGQTSRRSKGRCSWQERRPSLVITRCDSGQAVSDHSPMYAAPYTRTHFVRPGVRHWSYAAAPPAVQG